MTREEVNWYIDSLKLAIKQNCLDEKYIEAIAALKAQPCEDAVSREAVIAKAKDEAEGMDEPFKSNFAVLVEWLLDKLPPVTPKQRTGHWEMPQLDDGMSDPIYYQVRCSECGFDLDPQTWHMELHQYGADKYCPHCGAKMVESQESEDKE